MTFDEIKRIPDLQVNVMPAVEDAFYFLHGLEKEMPDPMEDESAEDFEARLLASVQPSINAGNRLTELPASEKQMALREAYRMIDNLKKYGVPCAAWV